MNINLANCNNISHGEISLQPDRLNILFAINGTGKSTIAKAIETCGDSEKLKELIPYKYLHENPLSEEHKPMLNCSHDIQNVAVFNDDYVNQYIYLPGELVANSFDIFVKTADYDVRMTNIKQLIYDINNTFIQNPELNNLIDDLTTFITGFGKTKSGYSITSSIGKGLAKGNRVANVPEVLTEFTPFIQSDVNAKWLAWQSKGYSFLDYADKCPFCSSVLKTEQKEIVKQVAIDYDTKYISELQKILGVFNSLEEYFTDKVNHEIKRLSNSSIGLTAEEINFLKEIKDQVIILREKLIDLRQLNFGTLKDVDKVIEVLESKKINLDILTHINSPHTTEYISILNDAIGNVMTQAGQLQGEINQQKILITNTIKKYNKEINTFLMNAGYNYQVTIIEDTDKNTYRMVLLCKESSVQIDDVKLHLSYGEKNAFALVLFMYKVLRENPDLIILDDPISSFDKNKKYAIMEMLFQGEGTLQKKTVMMLTHDLDPIVDLIHTTSIRCRFCPVPVASFLFNNTGILTEKEITPQDVKSFFDISNSNINNNDIDEIFKLIYLRRRLEACGNKGVVWHLLSNIFHPERQTPLLSDSENNRPMTAEEISEASELISEEIPDFDYNRIYTRVHKTKDMISLYKTLSCGYEKIQLYRIINHGNISDTVFKKFVDGVYHIENDSIFQLNPIEFPIIPEYIIKLCDNGIEFLENEVS